MTANSLGLSDLTGATPACEHCRDEAVEKFRKALKRLGQMAAPLSATPSLLRAASPRYARQKRPGASHCWRRELAALAKQRITFGAPVSRQ